jgi:hypothetical protein
VSLITRSDCNKHSPMYLRNCISHKGGVFDRDKSQTWPAQTAQEFRGADANTNARLFDSGEDVFGAEGVVKITEFPISLKTDFTGEVTDHRLIGLRSSKLDAS